MDWECASLCSAACKTTIDKELPQCTMNGQTYDAFAEYDKKTNMLIPGTLKFESTENSFKKAETCSSIGAVPCGKVHDIPPIGGCEGTRFGCCPDGKTAASGSKQEGCKTRSPCFYTEHGCCRDGRTAAKGEGFEGCDVGGCASTQFGCCPDTQIAAKKDMSNCPKSTGCITSAHGCCADGVTVKQSPTGANCNAVTTGGCHGTEFGCCPSLYGSEMKAAVGINADGSKICPVQDDTSSEMTPNTGPWTDVIRALGHWAMSHAARRRTGHITGIQ